MDSVNDWDKILSKLDRSKFHEDDLADALLRAVVADRKGQPVTPGFIGVTAKRIRINRWRKRVGYRETPREFFTILPNDDEQPNPLVEPERPDLVYEARQAVRQRLGT